MKKPPPKPSTMRRSLALFAVLVAFGVIAIWMQIRTDGGLEALFRKPVETPMVELSGVELQAKVALGFDLTSYQERPLKDLIGPLKAAEAAGRAVCTPKVDAVATDKGAPVQTTRCVLKTPDGSTASDITLDMTTSAGRLVERRLASINSVSRWKAVAEK
jgi:hypothetical protein